MYEWIKALHVIAVISWMAGMLYLPRLFVYHCKAEKDFLRDQFHVAELGQRRRPHETAHHEARHQASGAIASSTGIA